MVSTKTAKKRLVSHRYEQRRLERIARWAEGDRVLDVGYAQMPNRHLLRPGRTVTGCDLVEPTGETGYDEHLVADVFDLPRLLGERRFDAIVAGELIEHVEKPYDLCRAFGQLLGPGGRLLLSTPNPVSLPVVLAEWSASRRRFFTLEHTYYFTPRWMERLLEGAGFEVERTEAVGLWPFAVPCPVGLSYQVIYVAKRSGA